MAIKPKRSSGKKKTGALIYSPEQTNRQMAIWLSKMPPDCAAMIRGEVPIPSSIGERAMRDEVASASALLMHCVHYSPQTWQLPLIFEHTRMGRSIKWLQTLPTDQYGVARARAVDILQGVWPTFLGALQDPSVQFYTIPELWIPSAEEFGPLDTPTPYLPQWRVDDEDAAVRAVAQAAEEFAVYSLLVTWLNDQLGLGLFEGVL